jgi:CysZ protein
VNLAALVVYLTVAPLAPFVFWLVNGFLLGREYFQLVALRRLSPAEAAALRRRHAGRIWLAGTAMAVPLSVPVVNLLVPIVGVAVFTHQFQRMTRDAAVR